MATIDVRLSADVIVKAHGAGGESGRDIGDMLATFGAGAVAASQAAATGASWSLAGGTLRFDFGNGASLQYTGVNVADMAAQRGTATATGMSFHQNGVLSMSQTGHYDVGYTLINNVLSLTSVTGTTSGGQFATLVPVDAPNYSQTLGNIRIGFDSQLATDASGVSSGEITHITAAADRLVASTTIDGRFAFSGNLQRIGADLENAAVTGTLTNFRTEYQDGSHEYVTGALRLEAGESIDDVIANPARLSGDDVIRYVLPDSMPSHMTIAAGDGNDQVTVAGGGGVLGVQAGNGNDVILVLSDTHFIDGGEGIDTLKLPMTRNQYKVTIDKLDAEVAGASGSVHQTLHGVERVMFADTALALDIDGHAGQAYRLYQATFDRQPDLEGQGYWLRAMDNGASLLAVATGFLNAPEFSAKYGSASDSAFVTALYHNALHREPDQGGFDYYMNGLQHGLSRAQMLVNFSESPENQAQVIGAISDGITYI